MSSCRDPIVIRPVRERRQDPKGPVVPRAPEESAVAAHALDLTQSKLVRLLHVITHTLFLSKLLFCSSVLRATPGLWVRIEGSFTEAPATVRVVQVMPCKLPRCLAEKLYEKQYQRSVLLCRW